MNRDFTIISYSRLINAFLNAGYTVMPYSCYCNGDRSDKFLILRHDVDKHPDNALRIAEFENKLGVRSSFYFRSKFFHRTDIIRQIADLGHEVGYHYEDLVSAGGNVSEAYVSFINNLNCLRNIVPVSTIVMHGSPLSSINNLDLWNDYDFHELNIIGEPYRDINFDDIYYLTDTGRCWNGVSRRDVVSSNNVKWHDLSFHSTDDIISALSDDLVPKALMLNSHPQRWNDDILSWTYELVAQSVKNIIKRYVILMSRNNK